MFRRAAAFLFCAALAGAGCHRQPAVTPPAPTPPAAAPVAEPVAAASPSTVAPPQFVIVVSEDGLRPDVINAERTPNHVAFMREGMTARVARTIRESDTLPSHAAMLSGFPAKAHQLYWNSYKRDLGYIHVPTIFSIAKEHGLSTAMFIGKPKLRHIALPGSVDHLERPGYFCKAVVQRAAAYFKEHKPRLMFVHFSDPDEFGHSDGWMSAAYLKGAANSDRCLGTLLGAIDASGEKDRTLVIVTADHGGHNKVHSGSTQEVDREIPWIVRGPSIKGGQVLDASITTVDTAATVLSALKLPRPPHMEGQPRAD